MVAPGIPSLESMVSSGLQWLPCSILSGSQSRSPCWARSPRGVTPQGSMLPSVAPWVASITSLRGSCLPPGPHSTCLGQAQMNQGHARSAASEGPGMPISARIHWGPPPPPGAPGASAWRQRRAQPPSFTGRPPDSNRGPRLHSGPRLPTGGEAAGLRLRRAVRRSQEPAPGPRPMPSSAACPPGLPHPHSGKGWPRLERQLSNLLSAPPEPAD
ncbi:hypothetical protein NDU88_004887 [Pleurodeles waltl]|uniref:Uncharacterized protein n=1 Tax=Pleurodeles waltl TaxID=8319 RepID=A0AAV7RKQ8_PLEWA|nr:hypothetical protein NDU88_004887 [Pleurodeles waltl]